MRRPQKAQVVILTLLGSLFTSSLSCFADDQKLAPVKVFILAGQSNMQGKAKLSVLEHQIKDPKNADLLGHLKKDGAWVKRADVFISYFERKGPLTVGYGSDKNRYGPELEFGHVLGDHCQERVLIIKTSWGGKSLAKDFRPPSAGKTGPYYTKMIEQIHRVLKDIKNYVPGYEGQGYEVSGFVWFQGWNDMINKKFTAEYSDNMAHFIRDVRKELKRPSLPFVIGQMGVGGTSVNAKVQRFKDAQAAVLKIKEFQGHVAVVKTDEFWDKKAHEVFKKGWRKHIDEWNKVGGDYPFHYLGSCLTFSKIGRAFGEAMIKLTKTKKQPY